MFLTTPAINDVTSLSIGFNVSADTGNKIFAQIGSGLLMTSISQSFKNLITDDNLNAIYLTGFTFESSFVFSIFQLK